MAEALASDRYRALQALAKYLDAAASRPFGWSGWDCGLFVADWAILLTGRDPAASWRGHYDSERACARLTAPLGGYIGAFAYGALACGFAPTVLPEDGDAGLVELHFGRRARPCGAIRYRGRWAVLSTRGLSVLRAPTFAAWSLSRAASDRLRMERNSDGVCGGLDGCRFK